MTAYDADALATRIEEAKFQQTKFREGYDQDEIDDFLDEIIACVGGTAGQPAPRPEAPKVIEEYPKRSFLGRLFG